MYVCVYGKKFYTNGMVDEDSTTILEDFDNTKEAVNWAKRYCSKEDMGNWDLVYVKVYYQEPGEVIPWSELDNVKDPEVVWSCYQERMDWCDNSYEEF